VCINLFDHGKALSPVFYGNQTDIEGVSRIPEGEVVNAKEKNLIMEIELTLSRFLFICAEGRKRKQG